MACAGTCVDFFFEIFFLVFEILFFSFASLSPLHIFENSNLINIQSYRMCCRGKSDGKKDDKKKDDKKDGKKDGKDGEENK